MLIKATDPSCWIPGLDNAECSLASIYQSMPRDPSSAIPWVVRLLENPSSPVALAGAIDLFGHDCIHAVLGRGLLPQDEAFVLGFTMGSSRACTPWQAATFRWCAEQIYQSPYRFSRLDGEVFAFALAAARRWRGKPLNRVDFRAWLERPVGELRRALRIEPGWLRVLYRQEAECWPSTHASERLISPARAR